jgi:hypothetical protein
LCSSADIGNVPNNRYTTELAVLIGRDCRRFSVPIWKLERVAISSEKQNELKLGDNTLHFKSETPHLGLTRSSSDENRINIEERIALARRTLYSLIKTGVIFLFPTVFIMALLLTGCIWNLWSLA